MHHGFHKNIKQHNCFQNSKKKKKKKKYIYIYIYVYISWAPNQHIGMNSERLCDTEDWCNDAENSALHHRNNLHFKIH